MPDITSANITALLLSMQSQGKAQSTCVKVYTILHGLFKMAYMTDAVPHNPMDKVERPRPRKDEVQGKEVEAYTVEEVQGILAGLEAEPIKWRAYLRLLIDTGIRRGEACGLQWKDVDFQENTVTISGNLCYTPQKGVYLDTPKNGHTRTVDVDPDVMKLLRTLRASQKIISQYVFAQDNGEPIHPQSPTRYMKKFSERYGVPDLHPHKLRHSFAVASIENGDDIKTVLTNLGHATASFTLDVYGHVSQKMRQQSAERMNKFIQTVSA